MVERGICCEAVVVAIEAGELLDAFEQGALNSVATGQKDQRINIRLSSGDLQAIRTRPLQEGIPYQNLISSVLHKDVSGTLQERVTARL
ncbi:MAG: hypothetical protein FJ078_09365 [Cyanobacteria bacterium K_DeepCast_35m_m2_155]|nr:hypothetical protein [Cyanobacteria bacterium K_DeepCast_35m_m2_155]